MTTQSLRRGSAVIAAAALGASVLGVAAAPAQAAETDPGPAAAASGWLAGQLSPGDLIEGEFGPDYGLTIDVGLSLAATGEQSDALARVSDAVAAGIDDYIAGEAFGDVGSTYAGAAGKALVFSQVVGEDPTDFGGVDLVTRVEGVVDDTTGRSGDVSTFGDFANTIGQSFVVRGLDAAGSDEAAAATEFLLQQQCSEGFFRLAFSEADASDQTCDGDEAAEASVDVTATAILNLRSQTDDADVQAALSSALSWLTRVQNRDGSFGSDALITTANANSTGLAGWALGESGAEPYAESAAVWLRGHQAEAVAGCATQLDPADGAVAYDDAALETGRTEGVTPDVQDQFRRATAQAAPALRYAPLRNRIWIDRFPPYFADAGTEAAFFVSGFRPGETVCVTGPGVNLLGTASLAGDVRFEYTVLPGQRTYRGFGGSGDVRGVTITGLAKKTLKVRLAKKQVKRGGTQVVRVGGLVKRERVIVKRNGRVVARAEVRRAPLTVRIPSGAKLGKVKVVVVGHYADRRGSAVFRVVR